MLIRCAAKALFDSVQSQDAGTIAAALLDGVCFAFVLCSDFGLDCWAIVDCGLICGQPVFRIPDSGISRMRVLSRDQTDRHADRHTDGQRGEA